MYTESHRHLAGSISPESIWNVIRYSCNLSAAKSLDDVRRQVRLMHDNCNFDYFCTRFDILNKIEWHSQDVYYVAKQVFSDMKDEHIEHATLTVSLNKFVKSDDLVIAGYRVFGILDLASESNMDVNYLLSVSYDWPLELQLQTIGLIKPLEKFVAGIDFVGRESAANWAAYEEPLKLWKQEGKTIRAHVGERPGTSDNIDLAMKYMGITRIAHGIYATKEQQEEAIRRGIVFDMSIHSNIYTHAIELTKHPIKQMQEAGCKITLGTDDPVQFNCTLRDEYIVAEALGVDIKALRQMSFEHRIK
jgi:adenosine deaminase